MASGFTQLAPGTLGPVVLITCGADEFFDLYGITLTSNDTALQAVTIDDGVSTIQIYYVGLGQPAVLDISAVPFRGRRGGQIRVTAGAITAAKNINVKVAGLITKT